MLVLVCGALRSLESGRGFGAQLLGGFLLGLEMLFKAHIAVLAGACGLMWLQHLVSTRRFDWRASSSWRSPLSRRLSDSLR